MDVTKQYELMKNVLPLNEGLKMAYHWYVENQNKVNRKPYIEFIEERWEK